MIFVNFKSYKEALGSRAVQLAEVCKEVSEQSGTAVVPVCSTADVFRVTSRVGGRVWAQHCDPKESNRNTGWVTPLSLSEAGAEGVFLNHSEHPLSFADLKYCIKKAKKNDLKSLVFVDSLELAKKVDLLGAEFIAFEEPELVGGKKAIVEFKKMQKKIKEFAYAVAAVPLTGAGIRDAEDVAKSVELGAEGVVVASGIVKASPPKKALLELVAGFN